MVKFSEFSGDDFGDKIVEWLEAPVSSWQPQSPASAARVRAELDWQPLCRKAVDFLEKVVADVGEASNSRENDEVRAS
jgi:hypothetical protein